MEINPINTKRIYQNIIEQFIELIRKGELKVGDRLPAERALTEMFQVSRASIREAFSAMEVIGLIEVRPGDGSFVTDLNIGPFINAISPLFVKNDIMETDLLDFRKLIELEAVRLAAEKPDKTKFSKLQAPLEMMLKSIEKQDVAIGVKADINFHKTIFELTENYILIKSAECISYLLQSSVEFNRAKILKDNKNANVLYNQHRLIYEAVMNGDSKKAVEIMETHLEFVKKV